MHALQHTIKPTRFTRANAAAIARARELGYAGLADLDARGSPAHKAAVKAIHEAQK